MVRRQQALDRAIRPKLWSPGCLKFPRQVEVAFWEKIAKGLLAEEAAGAVGVAQAVGARCCERRGRTFVRSRERSAGIRGRSLASCAVTPQCAMAAAGIGRRALRGRQLRPRSA